MTSNVGNCLEVLSNYADYLNSHADFNDVQSENRPRPLFFTGSNCTGNVWPDNGSGVWTYLDSAGKPSIENGTTIINPYPDQLGSMWIPPNWTVIMTSPNGSHTFSIAPQTTGGFPVLRTSLETTFFDGSTIPLTNSVHSIKCFPPRQPDNPSVYQSRNNWMYNSCVNQVVSMVGARHLTSYQPGSTECDDFMTSYCHPVASRSCASGSNEIDPLEEQYTACACLVEENCLRDTFCGPGSTRPECADQTNASLNQFVPVTCFGKYCSSDGYKWARMQQQRCSITLCQQIVNLVGDDIIVKGGSTLWCGNRSVDVEPTPTPTPTVSPTDNSEINLPTWAWILIGLGALLFCVAIPLAIMVYWKNPNSSTTLPRTSSASAPPPLSPKAYEIW